jgi:hypothetical protein
MFIMFSPFLNLLLVTLSLLVVAFLAQGLEVGPVEEPVSADRPRYDVVHAGGRPDDTLAVAFGAEGMVGTEGLGEPRPPVRVVR